MEAFEVWFYRALIAGLLAIIAYLITRYINRQDLKNEQFFDLLDKNEQAITRLNTILDGRDRLCDERHRNLDRRLNDLHKAK